ncbi:MAG: response regulator transcription factor [Polyangiaceae bacterium]
MRVIVVDDSPAVRARLVAMLGETHDVQVVAEAWEGAEALRLVRLHAPDAVILDLNLPGMSGLDVLTVLKAEPSPPVVIILTNHPHDRYRAACLRGGADFFFDKSRDFDRVALAVAAAATPKS